MFYSFLIYFLTAVEVIVSVLLVVIVLMQRPKSEGLGAAFGGGMTDNLFGAQTTNVLAQFTRWLGGIFIVAALLLGIVYSKRSENHGSLNQQLLAPAKTAESAPAKSGLPVSAPLKTSPATNHQPATSPLAKPVAPAPAPAK